MKTTIEQIDLLRQRCNLSYKEAKEILEKFDGDLVDAIAYLEEENKLRPEKKPFKESTLFGKLKNAVLKCNKIKFIVSKDNKTILNLPLTALIVLFLISMPFAVGALIIALFTNCKIKFEKDSGEECCINNKLEKVSDTLNSAKDKITQEIKNL